MNKKSCLILVAFFLIFLLVSCNSVQQNLVEETKSEIFLPVVKEEESESFSVATEAVLDLFPSKSTVKFAQGFSIDYFDTYKVLTVSEPWSGAKENYTYILVPEGGKAPEEVGDSLLVNTPIESIVTMSTTYFTPLEKIGELKSLVGVDDTTYIYNENVKAMDRSGNLVKVGGGAGGGTVNLEVLIDLNPDLIMTSASGIPEYDAHPRLIEADLPVVINGDYLENSPLGRAEWIKFIAAFYNKEAEAEADFNEIVNRYNALLALASNITQKPTVFTNTDFQGTWYAPAGQSYVADLLRDAGAEYLWADEPGGGSIPLAFEIVFEKASEADFWLNAGFARDLASLLAMDERYQAFKAFEYGNVYNYNRRVSENGGMDYFESGVSNPDVVLADLLAIFHPELIPDHEFFYYSKLY